MTQEASPRNQLQPRHDPAARHSLHSHPGDDLDSAPRHGPARPGHLHQHDATSVPESSHTVPTVIDARGLGVTFTSGGQRTVALSDVNLTVHGGEFVSLIGPSGCGKTTLLRLVADLQQATTGTLTVNGATPEATRKQRAYGYVFQAPALYPWRNVERNVMLPLEVMAMPRAERQARTTKVLELVGLTEFRRRFPWQLSGGMQQRVSIARALSFEPNLLLMDEPFGALDEITRDGLTLHLHQLWRRTGLTAMFVTHSVQEAVFLSTRIVVMSSRPGRVVAVIESSLPPERDPDVRETPEFLAVAHAVRTALRTGHDDG
jgi:NitT/TauT family transport system ATP-binding protein